MSLALLTPSVSLDEGEVARTVMPDERVHVLAADMSVETFLAVRRALHEHRTVSPLPQGASDAALSERRAAVAALALGEDAFAVVATSGSTGRPKLVELSHRAAAAHADATNTHLALGPDDRWLVALPLCHVGGLATIVRCRAAGATVVLDPPPPLGPAWVDWLHTATARYRVTRLSLVPAQLDCLVRDARPAPSSIRTVLSGGQALPVALAASAVARRWPIVASYGLTETFGMCIATVPGDAYDGSVGRPLAGVRIRVVDERLEIATPALATAVHGGDTPTRDGWLRTADRARLDGDRVTLLGRADDVIVTGGHKVDPLEVEAALVAIPWVRDAAVVGVPDARFGERVAAAIVLSPEARAEGLVDRVWRALGHLPPHKRPRAVRAVAHLPRLANDKLDRRATRAQLAG